MRRTLWLLPAALQSAGMVSRADWESFSVTSPDGTNIPGLIAQPPTGGPFPAIVHLHGAPGARGASGIQQVATSGVGPQRWQPLIDAGFVVCVADWRGHPANNPGAALEGPVNATDDLQAVLAFLETQAYVDAARIGLIGDSMGARIVLETFEDRPLGPANLNYGPFNPYLGYTGPQPLPPGCATVIPDDQINAPACLARLASVNAPVLLQVGTEDGLCPFSHKLHELLLRGGHDSVLHDFAGSTHGFLGGPNSANFQEAAAEAVEFFELHFVATSGPQATGLSAAYRNGHVFLTWNEVGGSGIRYRVYRGLSPIVAPGDLASASLLGEVDDLTSENRRQTLLSGSPQFYRVTDLGPALTAGQGLFVETVAESGAFFYAVTAVTGGVEATSLAPGANATIAALAATPATPRPVLQAQSGTGGINRHYVHWVSNVDTPFSAAMWNAPSRAFNLRVIYSPAFANPRPVLLKLHARGGNYQAAGEGAHPEAIVVAPDDWIGQSPDNTFWYGFNEGFTNTATYPDHLNIDYSVRRVMAELDFAIAAFAGDTDRVYAAGGSMGAIGSVFIGYRHPDRFAAVHLVVPKFDFSCQENQCWIEPPTGDQLWGTPEDNLPTSDGVGVYDRLSISAQLAADPTIDRPIIVSSYSGRNDVVVGWPEKPPTYAAVQAARQPAIFFWDEGNHQGAGGVWATVSNQRRNDLWQHRIHRAIPVFTHLSLDDNPGSGDSQDGDLVGTINGYLTWNAASIVDTAAQHAVTCSLRSTPDLDNAPASTATVDWTPRRLQAFPRIAGALYRFRNFQLPGMAMVEERSLTAEPTGLLTVGAATITKEGNTFTLERACPADLNLDGTVNLADFSLMQDHFDDASPAPLDGDIDVDLDVDLNDFSSMAAAIGAACS